MSRHESNNYASSLDADSIFPIKCTDEVDVGDSDAQENNGPLSYRMSHLRRGDSEAGVALLSPDSMYLLVIPSENKFTSVSQMPYLLLS